MHRLNKTRASYYSVAAAAAAAARGDYSATYDRRTIGSIGRGSNSSQASRESRPQNNGEKNNYRLLRQIKI